MPPRAIPALLLLLLAMVPMPRAAQRTGQGNAVPFLYTVSRAYEPLAWMHGQDRFSPDVRVFIGDAQGDRPLAPAFAASADPSVSFDGRRVLFAGRFRPEDPWQIWEIDRNGGDARLITPRLNNCVRPFYLPEDRAVFACKVAGRYAIEAMPISGGKPVALTAGPANFLPTDVLRDGRILFEAGYPLGSETTPEIYTVYSDGSGVESYRCDHARARYAGRQVRSGDIVFASSRGLSRFTSARAQQLSISAPSGDYAGDVAEMESGQWLVAWRPEGTAPFRLMLWVPGSRDLQPLLEASDANQLQPTPLSARPVPNRHPSGLHDWDNANLLCLNAYTSRYWFAPGSIHSVRMYTRDGNGNAKLLGTAPVEHDGSFFVQVPSEQPLQIELADAAGKMVKREAGFFWMRRGEQRGCVGCHAGPETAPENAVPGILLRSTTPADMTGAHVQNAAGGD